MNWLSPAPRAGFVYLVGSWGFARCARYTPGFMLPSAPRTKKKLWGQACYLPFVKSNQRDLARFGFHSRTLIICGGKSSSDSASPWPTFWTKRCNSCFAAQAFVS